VVDVSTPMHRFDRAGILPRPVRSIPLWFGRKTVDLVHKLPGPDVHQPNRPRR
jgi:hypothetical protein